ncbi:hypothetical protein XENOCAPTIV_026345 [Xenoophorus captivus]|uniref:Uncharacterized protein n=1 Tax=Xenoophorus captivus TaxID=1517983 RepID=A0ABV0QN29_9TELE
MSVMHATLSSRRCRTCSAPWLCYGAWSQGRDFRDVCLTPATAANMLLPLCISKAPRCAEACCWDVLPVASEARLIIVELIKSLHTLNAETILQLVKEVVKRPHQIKGEQVHNHMQVKILKTFTVESFKVLLFSPEGNAGRYSHVTVQLFLYPEVRINVRCHRLCNFADLQAVSTLFTLQTDEAGLAEALRSKCSHRFAQKLKNRMMWMGITVVILDALANKYNFNDLKPNIGGTSGAQLLSSLSGYACTKRAWKKEVFELFMDPLFFTMDASCAHRGGDACALFSVSTSNRFIFPKLQRLTETLRMNPSPAVSAQMFLMFRVLLLRISSQHLTSLWPIMELNGLSEESSTEHLEFPLLSQSSLSSITQLLPFLRTLCCSFQAPPPRSQPVAYLPVADYPAASSHIVLSRLEDIIENEFLDSMES